MICNKIKNIFLFVIVYCHFNMFCMNNNSSCNNNCILESIIVADIKQYFLETCGENVLLDKRKNNKLECLWCNKDLSEMEKCGEDFEKVIEEKVCQRCAAARVVKLLLCKNFKESYLDKKLYLFNYKKYNKDYVFLVIQKNKDVIIDELARSYPIKKRLKQEDKKALIEVGKKLHRGQEIRYCQ